MRIGAQIHFPAKLYPIGDQTQADVNEAWRLAWLATDAARRDLGAGSSIRWDGLWHEADWVPWLPYGWERNVHIIEGLRARGLRSLLGLTANPWPTSGWGNPPEGWGALDPEQIPWAAKRLAERVGDYRAALAASGFSESESAIQIGNEPATPHPGSDPRGQNGEWVETIRRNLRECFSAMRPGGLEVISPAWSKQDHSPAIATLERTSSAIEADWARFCDRRALHHRFYQPDAASPAAYAQGWVAALRSRAQTILALDLPEPPGARRRERQASALWATETYVASSDCPGGLAGMGACWREVVELLLENPPPEICGLIVYRYWGRDPYPGGLRWDVPDGALTGVRG